MDGLDQVQDDSGCYDSAGLVRSEPVHSAVRNGFAPRSRPTDRWAKLARTIEGEVIPRLLMVHRSEGRGPPQQAEPVALGPEAVARLVEILRSDETDEAMVLIQRVLLSGVPLESVYLELMTPAARRLGELWLADECSFADVTMGLCRLQRVMRSLAHVIGDAAEQRAQRPGRILLASVPGEQHSFGVLMLEEFFRRDGWEVDAMAGAGRDQILRALRQSGPVAVGLSVSVEERIGSVGTLISEIRALSKNPQLVVMVGGRCFIEDPELAASVGADFTAVDGRQAIGQIQSMFPTVSTGG